MLVGWSVEPSLLFFLDIFSGSPLLLPLLLSHPFFSPFRTCLSTTATFPVIIISFPRPFHPCLAPLHFHSIIPPPSRHISSLHLPSSVTTFPCPLLILVTFPFPLLITSPLLLLPLLFLSPPLYFFCHHVSFPCLYHLHYISSSVTTFPFPVLVTFPLLLSPLFLSPSSFPPLHIFCHHFSFPCPYQPLPFQVRRL